MNRTLYVRHSGQALDLSAIGDLLATVGDVESSRVEVNSESATHFEMGVFEMSTALQAKDCVDRFHGYDVRGHSLSVELQRPAAARPRSHLGQRKAKVR